MNILVTGGAGFIGSHLCQKLLTQGHYVICLDNNFTGSLDNIRKFRDHERFEFIRHDVTEKILLEVDQIYHLACPASPKSYQYNAIKTIKTNRRFVVRINRDMKTELVFGSGTGDLADIYENPDYRSVYDDNYLQNMTNVALDTLNFTNSNSFGSAPGDTTLTRIPFLPSGKEIFFA